MITYVLVLMTVALSEAEVDKAIANILLKNGAQQQMGVIPDYNQRQNSLPMIQQPMMIPQHQVPVEMSLIQETQAQQMTEQKIPCTCGVFLSGQFKKGSNEQPTGNAVLMQEMFDNLPCNVLGEKQCTNKCLDVLVKHLPNSPALVCGSMDRDCYKERAYLFIKNCEDRWSNTNLSAGREFCCKDNMPYKCPVV